MSTELNLLYVHSLGMGYGRLGVNLAREVTAAGVDVYDKIPTPLPDRMKHSDMLLQRGESPDTVSTDGTREGVAGTICWVSVPTHATGWWKGQRPCIFTMFEATQLPESFRETLHNFDRVIVPSPQNLELFSRYHSDVRLVPLGVDPADWHYTPRRPPTRFFNFLIGGSGKRKGTDLAYEAFQKVFPKELPGKPIPRLILKNPRGENFPLSDRVEMVTGKITGEQEVALYEAAHCYLQPSRGEGFGLQPLQAIAQGCPTILTAAHGHESFAHLGLGLDTTFEKAAYFIFGNPPDMMWYEPDFEQLCEHMWDVYNNYDLHALRSELAAMAVADEFTWKNVGENFLRELGELPDYQGPMEWYAPEVKKFRTRVNRPYSCEVAGAHYQMLPGRDYYLLADVKRVLFEGGILDPDCLGTDDGLTPEQVARVEEYSATHGNCLTCGQSLQNAKYSDQIYEDLVNR